HALAYRKKRWQESRHSVTYLEQAAMWRDWRNEEPEDNPLRMLNMSAGQQVLRRLDSAYRQFVKGKRGAPRFKRLDRFHSVNYKPGDGAALKDGRLYVQNVGLIKVRWHRALPGLVKNIILTGRNGRWHVCFQVEIEGDAVSHPGPAVGIDVGIHHALALSTGEFVDSPRHLAKAQASLRVLQRTVARRTKGGKNRRKAVRQLARQHERVANARRDFWHKTTRKLANEFSMVVVEDLNLSFMLRNSHLARAAHDIGLGLFRELLAYKAVEAGGEVVAVSPKGTSQLCSGCGSVVQKALRVRVHHCLGCGLILDRDTNAALNILSAGTRPLGVNVDGGIRRSPRSSPL
ncbi:MAG: transposase, partial [Chloroflexi bacterium]|nr:transposase [Chloroflexota bacterium]